MEPDRVLSMIGLAMKAGKLVSGEYMTEKTVKTGKAYLVIIAEDASANTKKDFSDSCSYYQVPIVIYGTKEDSGHAMGKQIRASLAITDEGFAKEIMKKVELEIN